VCSYLPYRIIEAPYLAAFYFLNLVYKISITGCKVGYRNSVAFSCVEPFFSDLDITVICTDKQRSKAKKLFQALKRLIPWLGELNLYSAENLQEAVKVCNTYEMRRDPLLAKKFSSAQDAGKAEKFVFAFRMLNADWNTLNGRPATRQKKWSFHFGELGYAEMKEYSHRDVLSFLLKEIGAEDHLEKILEFKEILSSTNRTPHFTEVSNPVIQALYFNNVCYVPPSPSLTQLQKEIILAQAKWEIWAMEVTRDAKPQIQVVHHINNIHKFLGLAELTNEMTRI
jgi:hypothetical protein